MELKLIRHLWGVEQAWEETFPRFRAEGFTGIECRLPVPIERGRFQRLLAAYGFAFIPQIFTDGTSVAEHLASFRAQVQDAVSAQPLLINAHTGSDAWSLDEAKRFYDGALAVERAAGVTVCHETHRGRYFYSPWVTRDLIKCFPDLRLCCDFSHWVCVAERLIDSELPIIRLCAELAGHVHARVGYEEGPQVPDPRAPEYLGHVEAHERWWDLVWQAQQARGMTVSTLTPEFGPPAYLHTIPHTNAPVADLWAICAWQAKRQAERFAAGGWRRTGASSATH